MFRDNKKTIEDIIQDKMNNMLNYKSAIQFIKENGINVTVRREFGGNIKAACGQLRSESD